MNLVGLIVLEAKLRSAIGLDVTLQNPDENAVEAIFNFNQDSEQEVQYSYFIRSTTYPFLDVVLRTLFR